MAPQVTIVRQIEENTPDHLDYNRNHDEIEIDLSLNSQTNPTEID
jgi:hypothetical protein